MTIPRITELDFDTQRENLKQFLKQSNVFKDYNFDGSALSLLLDVHGHATYYKAFYLNMLFNELFLDSSLLRGPTVSRAKELDYTPRSAKSAQAVISVSLAPYNFSTGFVIVPKYTQFRGTINNQQYAFSTDADTIVNRDANGFYKANLSIYEGDIVTETTTIPVYESASYTLPLLNQNVDTSSLSVFVKDSAASSSGYLWKPSNDILAVTGDSLIYFAQENMHEKWELQFGDGILGKKLVPGNVVTVTYRVTNGSAVNGCKFFQQIDQINGVAAMTIDLVTAAFGGDEKETIESIRFNAPRAYDKQNRIVTENDYLSAIKQAFPYVQNISVWNGAKNHIPVYGKVFISVKPKNGFTLSDSQKNQISSLIQSEQMLTVTPQFVDATFNYVIPKILVKYNSQRTSLTPQQVLANIVNTIKTYETSQLGDFKKPFYASRFGTSIDVTDASISGSSIDILLQKRFLPQLNSAFTYAVNFHKPIHHPYDGYLGAVSSSPFRVPLYGQWLYMDDDGHGRLRVYYLDGTKRVYVPYDGSSPYIGTVDYSTGFLKFTVPISAVKAGNEIQVTIAPADKDITPTLNEILLITQASINIIDESTGASVANGTVNTAGDTTTLYQNLFYTSTVL